jgi:hypothetical protein
MVAISSVTEMGRGDDGRAPVASVVEGFHGEAPLVEAEGFGAGEGMRRPTRAPPHALPREIEAPPTESIDACDPPAKPSLLPHGGWGFAE